jgi:hypothetical protein
MRHFIVRVVVVAWTGWWLLLAGPSHGATPEDTDAKEDPRGKFETVSKLLTEGQYGTAVGVLQGMVTEYEGQDAVCRRAYAELVFVYFLRQDEAAAARVASEALLRYPDISPDPAYVPHEVGDLFDQLRGEILGSLIITTTPDGCEILLNDKSVGRTPLALAYVSAGEYDVIARKKGYHDLDNELTIEPGTKTGLHYALVRIGGREGPRTGFGGHMGFAMPIGQARSYTGTGLSGAGYGWFEPTPGLIIQPDIQALFLSEKSGETIGSGATAIGVKHSAVVLKIVPKVEYCWISSFIEPYVGAGLGLFVVWASTDFAATGQSLDEKSIPNSGLGATATAGLRVHAFSDVAFDVGVQYDFMPKVEIYLDQTTKGHYDFQSLTFAIGVNFGASLR